MKVARPVRRAATGNGPEATRAPRPWPTLLDCALCVCPVKQQAKQRLIEAKHLVPDSGRE